MDFDAEDIDIMLPLLVASGKINFLSILSKSRRRLVWVKPWLKRIQQKVFRHNNISKLQLQDHYDYQKYFRMNFLPPA